ncbi:rhodopsin [Paenibacillus algicola]|uniref:Rhodopsin n=1 Tax=Paenibacillus algicola TaxID=2565926 RepID=A0A4P8XNV2_9BACL|nr:bacteriorhodopsin [Paenibacillus algicola]QCT03410.1 rhodopsin [Paenibacillus algicola]
MQYPIEQQILWGYAAVMAAGAVIFAVWSFNRKQVPRYEYLIAFIIPVWSGAAYLSMAMGQGHIVKDGHLIYFARYLDWIVTTPLLLVALATTAMSTVPKDRVILWGLVAADVFMILTGLIADLSPRPEQYVWYSLGCAAFLIIMYVIWVHLRIIARSQNPSLYKHFLMTASYLTVLWFGYPTLWIIGPSGFGWTSQVTDTLMFCLLPIFSKVGFSLLDLSGLRRLHGRPVGKKGNSRKQSAAVR